MGLVEQREVLCELAVEEFGGIFTFDLDHTQMIEAGHTMQCSNGGSGRGLCTHG